METATICIRAIRLGLCGLRSKAMLDQTTRNRLSGLATVYAQCRASIPRARETSGFGKL